MADALAQRHRVGQGQARRHVAVQRVVGRGLVGQDVRREPPAHQRGQHVGAVSDQAYGERRAPLLRISTPGQGLVQRGRGFVQVASLQATLHAGRVHLKAARLHVLQKCLSHVRRERIRLDDDGLSVIRNQDFKNALEELPGSFASLDRAWGRFFESGIHKAIARAHGGKDPGTKAPTLPG